VTKEALGKEMTEGFIKHVGGRGGDIIFLCNEVGKSGDGERPFSGAGSLRIGDHFVFQ
jgi:hypothetical protein